MEINYSEVLAKNFENRSKIVIRDNLLSQIKL